MYTMFKRMKSNLKGFFLGGTAWEGHSIWFLRLGLTLGSARFSGAIERRHCQGTN